METKDSSNSSESARFVIRLVGLLGVITSGFFALFAGIKSQDTAFVIGSLVFLLFGITFCVSGIDLRERNRRLELEAEMKKLEIKERELFDSPDDEKQGEH